MPPALTGAALTRALGMYQKGWTLREIAKALHVSYGVAQRVVAEAGLTRGRGTHNTLQGERLKQALHMYRTGVKISEICSTVRTCRRTLYREVDAAGIPRRRDQRQGSR